MKVVAILSGNFPNQSSTLIVPSQKIVSPERFSYLSWLLALVVELQLSLRFLFSVFHISIALIKLLSDILFLNLILCGMFMVSMISYSPGQKGAKSILSIPIFGR